MTSNAQQGGRRVHFVSLGCPKNRVDTERMVELAARQGLEPVADPHASDIVIVNTCGFIEAAKQESIDTILEMAELKHSGRLRSLVVAGCLSQRYPDQLARELPEVDHFIGTADLGRLAKILADAEPERVTVGDPVGLEEQEYGRRLIGPPHSAYLKISEGCDRPCAFCIIPAMRGRQRSRTVESLVDEARGLAQRGVRELILIAQDTTAYGKDLPAPGRPQLADLIEALDGIEGLAWIRLHYAYPSMVDARLARTMADAARVVPYVDMPIQHVDDDLLKRMRRGYTGARVRETVDMLRQAMPDVAIRSTMLCGHPGETDEAHRALLAFVEQLQLDHLGAFVFSPEEGTHAATQPDPVPEQLAEQRVDEVMELQREISRRKLERLRGQTIDVMVDGPSDESEFLLAGRHAGQSPDVDGLVILTNGEASPGQIVRATVTDSADYDLVASLER